MLSPEDEALAYCYLTTTGRTTGQPREIEIWFGSQNGMLYLLAGGGEHAHWVRNIAANPEVTVRVGATTYPATGRRTADAGEEALARKLLLEKYSPGYSGDLTEWGRTALPIALELRPP